MTEPVELEPPPLTETDRVAVRCSAVLGVGAVGNCIVALGIMLSDLL